MQRKLRTLVVGSLALSALLSLAGCAQIQDVSVYKPSFSERMASWSDGMREKLRRDRPTASPSAPSAKVDEDLVTAQVLEQKGEVDRAIDAYRAVAKRYPKRADIQHRLAVLYDVKCDAESAMKCYELARKRDPRNVELLCDLGYHYYMVGQLDESERLLREAIEEHPTALRAHNNLALVLARKGKHEEALTEFVRGGNTKDTAHVNLAYGLMWDRQWDEAVRHVDEALAIQPCSATAKEAGKVLFAQIDASETEKTATPIGP